jgi:predicted PurR-regulated permease PerM
MFDICPGYPLTYFWSKKLCMLNNSNLQRFLVIIVLILVLMYFGRILFIPLFFALLVSFIIYPVCLWLENKGLSRSLSITASMIIAFVPVAGIGFVLIQQVIQIGNQWPFISRKLLHLLDSTDIPFYTEGMNLQQKEAWLKKRRYTSAATR